MVSASTPAPFPRKTLREAVLYLTGLNQREMYGQIVPASRTTSRSADLAARTSHVIGREVDVIRNQLSRNRVTLLHRQRPVRATRTPLAVTDAGRPGRTRSPPTTSSSPPAPCRPGRPPWTSTTATIIDSDGIVNLDRVPRSMVVVGAGVIGIEYASMFAALGTKVTVVERRARMLEFCDLEIIEALKYHLRDLAVTFRFGETVAAVERHPA